MSKNDYAHAHGVLDRARCVYYIRNNHFSSIIQFPTFVVAYNSTQEKIDTTIFIKIQRRNRSRMSNFRLTLPPVLIVGVVVIIIVVVIIVVIVIVLIVVTGIASYIPFVAIDFGTENRISTE